MRFEVFAVLGCCSAYCRLVADRPIGPVFLDYLTLENGNVTVVSKRRQRTTLRHKGTVFFCKKLFIRVREIQGTQNTGLSLFPFDGVF